MESRVLQPENPHSLITDNSRLDKLAAIDANITHTEFILQKPSAKDLAYFQKVGITEQMINEARAQTARKLHAIPPVYKCLDVDASQITSTPEAVSSGGILGQHERIDADLSVVNNCPDTTTGTQFNLEIKSTCPGLPEKTQNWQYWAKPTKVAVSGKAVGDTSSKTLGISSCETYTDDGQLVAINRPTSLKATLNAYGNLNSAQNLAQTSAPKRVKLI